MKTENEKSKVLSIISIVLIVILAVILLANFTIIIKGTLNPEEPPSLFGVTPLVVLTGSMEGEAVDSFPEGTLILVRDAKEMDLNTGDVIAFFDPASKNGAITTHRITEVIKGENGVSYKTQGDANNAEDELAVPCTAVIGKYWFHIEGVGSFAMFLQEPVGMLLFIGLPTLAFLIYEFLRRKISADKRNSKTAELEAEIERLRALAREHEEKTEENTTKIHQD